LKIRDIKEEAKLNQWGGFVSVGFDLTTNNRKEIKA
jgi:hypothetical protein